MPRSKFVAIQLHLCLPAAGGSVQGLMAETLILIYFPLSQLSKLSQLND